MNKRNFLKCIGVALVVPSVAISANPKSYKIGDRIIFNGSEQSIKAASLNEMIEKIETPATFIGYKVDATEPINCLGKDIFFYYCEFDMSRFKGGRVEEGLIINLHKKC